MRTKTLRTEIMVWLVVRRMEEWLWAIARLLKDTKNPGWRTDQIPIGIVIKVLEGCLGLHLQTDLKLLILTPETQTKALEQNRLLWCTTPTGTITFNRGSRIRWIITKESTNNSRASRELTGNSPLILKSRKFTINHLLILAREKRQEIQIRLLWEEEALLERVTQKINIMVITKITTEVTKELILNWLTLTLISRWEILKDNGLQALKMHSTCQIIEALARIFTHTNNNSKCILNRELVEQIEDIMEHKTVVQALNIQATTPKQPILLQLIRRISAALKASIQKVVLPLVIRD